MRRNRLASSFAFTIVLCAHCVARAQPLADLVPADAIIYVGWVGTGSMGAKYETSHFKAVLDASNVPAVFETLLPQFVQRVEE